MDLGYGPAEVKVTEVAWDLGDGPETGQFSSAPGWAFGLKSESIGEVNPDQWTSLDVTAEGVPNRAASGQRAGSARRGCSGWPPVRCGSVRRWT
jgi:hypothetical protein